MRRLPEPEGFGGRFWFLGGVGKGDVGSGRGAEVDRALGQGQVSEQGVRIVVDPLSASIFLSSHTAFMRGKRYGCRIGRRYVS